VTCRANRLRVSKPPRFCTLKNPSSSIKRT